MDGDDGGDLDVGDAEDLVGLVGLPPGLAQRGDEQVAAVPHHPVLIKMEPSSVLLAVDGHHPGGADDQVIDVGLGVGDGQVVQDRPAAPLQLA